MLPRMSSPRTTTSGTGSCRRNTSRMSDSVSSGSHSAPIGDAMVSSSGMDSNPARQPEIRELARRDHPHHGLVLMRDDGEPSLMQRHQGDDLTHTLMFVDEQWRRMQHVASLHRSRWWTHREIAAGHHDVAGDEATNDILFGDVA